MRSWKSNPNFLISFRITMNWTMRKKKLATRHSSFRKRCICITRYFPGLIRLPVRFRSLPSWIFYRHYFSALPLRKTGYSLIIYRAIMLRFHLHDNSISTMIIGNGTKLTRVSFHLYKNRSLMNYCRILTHFEFACTRITHFLFILSLYVFLVKKYIYIY